MAEGELQCCGSSLFLKNKFGSGYTLTVCKARTCNVPALQGLVLGSVRGATLTSNVGAEISFKLPLSEASGFSDLFTKFEEQKASLGIEQFGVSVTTMEEVFIRVAEEGDHALDYDADSAEGAASDVEDGNGDALDDFGKIVEDADAFAEFTRHFEALLLKRWRYGRRDKIAIFCTTVLPVVMLLLGLLMLKYASLGNILDQPALNMDLVGAGYADYGDSVTVPYHQRSSSNPITLSAGESALALHPKKIDLDLTTATGVFGGVEYDAGIPTKEWAPRSDRMPDYDPRHQPSNKVGFVNDPEPVLAMSQVLMSTDLSEQNSPVFAALLVSSLSNGTNICGQSGETVLTRSHSAIFGGRSELRDCTMTIRAPPGHVVHLTFATMDHTQYQALAITVFDGDVTDDQSWSCCGGTHPRTHTLPSITSSTSVLTVTQTLASIAGSSMPENMWSAVATFEATCADIDIGCRDAIGQIEQFGITCTMTLAEVDVDTIELPDPLPNNPATGE